MLGPDHHAELEVFAVVKRVLERGDVVALAHHASISMDRNRGGIEHGTEAAALGEHMAQVGGKSIGNVDHGVNRCARIEREGLGNPRLGPKVAPAKETAAQRAGHEDRITGLRTRPPYGADAR